MTQLGVMQTLTRLLYFVFRGLSKLLKRQMLLFFVNKNSHVTLRVNPQRFTLSQENPICYKMKCVINNLLAVYVQIINAT